MTASFAPAGTTAGYGRDDTGEVRADPGARYNDDGMREAGVVPAFAFCDAAGATQGASS